MYAMRLFACIGLVLVVGAGHARAACNIIAFIAPSVSISPAIINLGTNVAPNAVSVTVSATYFKLGNGPCSTTDSVAFASPLTLTGPGGALLNYTVTPAGGVPSFPPANVTNGQFVVTATLTVTVTLPGGQTGPSGIYNGTLQAQMELAGGGLYGTPGSAAVTASITNPPTCTIGGVANGGTQTLDFSNGPSATISLGSKIASFGAVTCNAAAILNLTSQNGAALSGASATPSHQNFFDYVATTTINGGTVTLSTSSNPASGAPESATGSITALSTTNAPLAITVTPQGPVKPLVAGGYADVLTLTITPN